MVFSASGEGAVAYTITIGTGVTVQTNSITFNQAVNSTHTISGGTIAAGASPLVLNSSAAGTVGGRNKTIASALTGTAGLTVAANGDTSDTGGGSASNIALIGANTISGGVTITSGLVTTNSNFGNAANSITLSGGGLVDTGSNTNFTRSLIIPASTIGTYRTYGNITGRLSGSLIGSGSLRHSDTGTLILSGDKTGFSGTVINGAGTLILEQADWSANDFVQTDNTNVLRLGLAGETSIKSLTSDRDVVIPFGARLNIVTGTYTTVGAGPTYNGFWMQGTTTGLPSATGSLTSSSGTLTITTGAATGLLTTTDNQVRVKVEDFNGSTPLALVKNNVNSLGLDLPNTFTGGTTLNGGRLNANHVQAFGTGTVTVNSGAQAFLNVQGVFANSFVLNGNGVSETAGNLGAIRFQNNTVSGSVNVASAARITAQNPATYGTITGALTGSAPLEINSPAASNNGIINLVGSATGYTGLITLTQGTLNSGSLGGGLTVTAGTATVTGTVASNVTVNGGTAAVSGNITGNITVADAATFRGEGTAANVTFGTVTGANLVANAATTGALTANTLTVNGIVTVSLTGAPAAPGPIPLLNFTTLGGTPPTAANFALANAAAYRGATFAVNANDVTLDTSSLASTWTGSVNGNWNLNTDANFSNGSAQTFYAGDTVTFDDTSAVNTVALVGTLNPGAVTINNTATTYVFNGAGNLAGNFPLVKSGTGTTTLGGTTNTYTGNISVTGGILKAGSATAFGQNSSISVASGAQVDINGQTPGTVITGGYSFTIAGAGPDGNGAITNTGAGAASNAGVKSLTLSGNASVGATGATSRFDIGLANVAGQGTINGNGFTLTKVGANQIQLRGPVTNMPIVINGGSLGAEDNDLAFGGATGSVTVNGGTVASYGVRTIATPITLAASGTAIQNLAGGGAALWTGSISASANSFTVQTDAQLTLAGNITGSGVLTRNGTAANFLILTGSNPAFTGSVVANGNLTLGNGGSTGSLGAASSLTMNAGTLFVSHGASVTGVLPPVTLVGTSILSMGTTLPSYKNTLTSTVSSAVTTTSARIFGGVFDLTSGATLNVGGTLALLGGAANIGTLNILPGSAVSTNYFAIGNEANNNYGIVNQSGGTATVNAGSTGFRLGHWNNNSPALPNQYNLTGGTLDATALSANATTARMVNVGWDGYGVMTVGGGASTATLKAFGVQLDANGDSGTYNSNLVLSTNGVVEIGSGGIAGFANDRLIFNGGTARTRAHLEASPVTAVTWSVPTTVNAATTSTLEVPATVTHTLSGAMIGTGTLNKTGAGNLVLTSANLTGFTGTLGINDGGLAPGGLGTAGTLTLASGAALSVGTGGALTFDLNGASTVTGNDQIAVNGNLTFAAGSYLRPVFTGVPVDGNYYKVMTYTGTLTGAPVIDPTFETGTRVIYDVVTSIPGEVGIEIVGTVASVVWVGDGTTNNWDAGVTQNWLNGGTPDAFFNADGAAFDESGNNAVPVNVIGSISPSSFTIDATKDYVFSGAGSIVGGTGLTKSGTGRATFLTTNTNTGALVINGGTIQVGNGGTTGTVPGANAITFASGTTLEINHSNNETLGRQLGGTGGTFVKNGSGTLSTSVGGNTVDITVNGGGLVARGGGFSAAYAAGKLITMNPGTTLDTAVHTMGSSVGGGGDVPRVTLNGANWILNGEQYMRTLTLNAATTTKVGVLDGIRTLAGSVYTVEAAATSSTIGSPLNLVNAVSLFVDNGAASDDLVVSGLITNIGSMTKLGTGKMAITGTANTFTGTFNIFAGTVSIPTLNETTVAGPLGQAATVNLDGATLDYTGATATSGRVLSLGVTGGTLAVSDAAANLTLTGVLAANSLTKSGPGTLSLNAVNTHASTTVAAGTLVPVIPAALGAGSVTVTGGSLNLNGLSLLSANTVAVGAAGTLTGAGTFTSAGTVNGTLNPGGTGTAGRIVSAGTLTLGSTAIVNLEIGGIANGSFDVVEAQADIALAGTVNLSLINGFSPALGNSFDLIVDDGGQTGSVTLGTLPTLGAGLAWNTSAFATTGVVSVVSADPVAAYTAGFSLTGNDALPGADPDSDGISNAMEYALGISPIANNGPEYRGIATVSSGALTLSYRRPIGGVPGVTYGVEIKNNVDLVVGNTGWTPGVLNTDFTVGTPVPHLDGTTETVTITITVPVSGKKFARLSATY